MPHVDEGTLHALLDGELEPAEVQQVQTHFATCPACQSRLDEARQMMEETERLLKALEPQAAASSGPRAGASRAEPPGVVPPPPPSFEEQVKAALDPMVLIPDNPLASEVRRRRLRAAAWAAGLLIAFGAGGFAVKSGMLSDKPTGELHVRPEDFQPVSTPNPQEVRAATPPAAAAEPAAASAGAESAPATPAPSPAAPAASPLAAAHPVDSAKGAAPAPAGSQPGPPAQMPAPAPTPPQVAASSAPAPDSDVTPSGAASAAGQERAPAAQAKAARDSRPQETRSRTSGQDASDAMRALDRQKAADASRRALATIDAERRTRQQQAELSRESESSRGDTSAGSAPAKTENAPPPPAPPQPPPLEQRAQITSRIGLDEATRLLGGPLHAIDAADYTRQFVGIVSGASVPGADPTRPVVRAVYVDRSGRVLYLDQQRVRPGQSQDLPTSAPEGGNDHRWVIGGTLLRLTGERTSAALDSLARRVR